MNKYLPVSRDRLEKQELFEMNILSLSMIGDGVHTLFLRAAVLDEVRFSTEKLHALTAKYACAESQAEAAKKMLPLLNEDEKKIFSKAKNSHPHTMPKHATLYEYRLASAFEAVTGYLYLLAENERLAELYNAIYGDCADKPTDSVTQTEDNDIAEE